MSITENKLKEALLNHFGHSSFRSGQLETMQSLFDGSDTLVVMPTGGGKSLCYQLPALFLDGTALVISPLIALMKDQVDSLEKNDIPATFINSSLPYKEIQKRLWETSRGKYKLIYFAPERLKSTYFKDLLDNIKLSFIAIDEAHCISEWGHDFRPSYQMITDVFKEIKRVPLIALTATATPEVRKDIVRSLNLKAPNQFVRGFDRPNLKYSTIKTHEKFSRLLRILKKEKGGSTIVYCGTRKRVEEFTEDLAKNSIPAEMYHAGLKPEIRKSVQERFIKGKTKVIVATNAFGMGIDKEDVRRVIHCDMPGTLESYYQEAGRAGRDGQPAECTLIYHYSDMALQEYFINMNYPDLADIRKVYNKLYDTLDVGTGQKAIAPVFLDNVQIGNRTNLSEKIVASALGLLERNGILSVNKGFSSASLQFTCTRERLLEYHENTTETRRRVLDALLRGTSSDSLSKHVNIRIGSLAAKYNLNNKEIQEALTSFEFARIISYQPEGGAGSIMLRLERMVFERLPIDFDAYNSRRDYQLKKLQLIMNYADTHECKRNFILNYFKDDTFSGTCGQCSSCSATTILKKPMKSKIKRNILDCILNSAAALDGNFGRTILAEFVKGTKSRKVIKHKLAGNQLFGCGADFNNTDIKEEIDRAVYKGLLNISADIHPTISLTDDGKKQLPQEAEKIKVVKNKTQNSRLYIQLKKLRDHIAGQRKLVPRAIATDIALRKLADKMPSTIDELTDSPGIGPVFIENFGDQFLGIIRAYKQEIVPVRITLKPIPKESQTILKLLDRKLGLKELSTATGESQGIIARHIQVAIESGYDAGTGHIVDSTIIKSVEKVMSRLPGAPLREIRQQIKQPVDYPRLRIALAIVRAKNQKS